MRASSVGERTCAEQELVVTRWIWPSSDGEDGPLCAHAGDVCRPGHAKLQKRILGGKLSELMFADHRRDRRGDLHVLEELVKGRLMHKDSFPILQVTSHTLREYQHGIGAFLRP